MIVWFTGLSGAGKTTLARELEKNDGFIVVDADVARRFWQFGFTDDARKANAANLQALARFLSAEGCDVAVAAMSPFREQREAFKKENDVLEVYVHGRGQWATWYGPNIYEPPRQNYLGINTAEVSIQEAAQLIRAWLDYHEA